MIKAGIFAFLLFFSMISAFRAHAAETPTISYTFGVLSAYLAKPGLTLFSSPIATNEIRVSFPEWYAGVWSSTGFNNKLDDFDDEIDGYVGYRKRFSLLAHPLESDVKVSYFVMTPVGDQIIFDGKLTLLSSVLQPYVSSRFFGEVNSESPPEGWFTWIGVKKSLPLGFKLLMQSKDLSLDADGHVAFSHGALGGRAGFIYARFGVSLPIEINDRLTLSPLLVYQLTDGGQRGLKSDYTRGDKILGGFFLQCDF